jgi:hypothetical protein
MIITLSQHISFNTSLFVFWFIGWFAGFSAGYRRIGVRIDKDLIDGMALSPFFET